ncbi:MAG: hypothetical protein M0C28_01310 [Candidatus Moduliflexus flocculans]|nr:hypothetical protein [Candidatus Moduliflexus flocculans]
MTTATAAPGESRPFQGANSASTFASRDNSAFAAGWAWGWAGVDPKDRAAMSKGGRCEGTGESAVTGLRVHGSLLSMIGRYPQ